MTKQKRNLNGNDLEISETALKQLIKIPKELNLKFQKHIEKLIHNNQTKHLTKIPYFVEKITKSARIIYVIKNKKIIILFCFKTHKEYEKWYKKFK